MQGKPDSRRAPGEAAPDAPRILDLRNFVHLSQFLEPMPSLEDSHERGGGKDHQFVLDQRDQFLGGPGFALLHAIQNARDLAQDMQSYLDGPSK
jgi:hypothetical protein